MLEVRALLNTELHEEVPASGKPPTVGTDERQAHFRVAVKGSSPLFQYSR